MKNKCLMVLCCLCVAILTGCNKSPSDTYKAFSKALERKDYEKAYKYMSNDDVESARVELKAMLVMAKGLTGMMSPEDARKMVVFEEMVNGSTKDFFIGMMKEAIKDGENPYDGSKILREEIDGDSATVWVQGDTVDEEQPIPMVKEDGQWVLLFHEISEE